MQFLKTAFWVIMAVVIVIFSFNNWVPVKISLWDGLFMDTKLPVVVIGSFLAGMLPMWVWLRTTRWRLKRRLDSAEQTLANIRTAATPAAPPPALSSGDAP